MLFQHEPGRPPSIDLRELRCFWVVAEALDVALLDPVTMVAHLVAREGQAPALVQGLGTHGELFTHALA